MKRIKELSQRLQDGTFSTPFPLGANALNVDMLSGNNLEEELHLGSPSTTTFNVDTDRMTITEEYKKEETQNEGYYIVKTVFKGRDEGMDITQKLYFKKTSDSEQKILKKSKTITFTNDNHNFKIKEVVS